MQNQFETFMFSFENISSSENLSSNSEIQSQNFLSQDKVEISLENEGQSTNSPLSFLMKTKTLINNYTSACSKMMNGKKIEHQNKKISLKDNEFLEFDSEDEEIGFSSDDYINIITQELTNKKTKCKKQFKNSERKIIFDFKQYNETNKLNFVNSALRRMFNKLVVLNKGRDDSKNIQKIRVYSCKHCFKRFEDGRKLGGHVSKFHSNKKTNFTL